MQISKKKCVQKRLYLESYNTCICEYGRYARSIVHDSVTRFSDCDEIAETTKIIPTNFNEKKVISKMKNFYTLFVFLSTTMILLIAASIYYSLTIYQTKQTPYYHFMMLVIKKSI